MKRMNGSLLVLAMAGGLAAVPVLSNGARLLSGPPSGASLLDDEQGKFPHMHRALARLREGREELVNAEPIFEGHRVEAIGKVDAAINEVKTGLTEQGEKTDAAMSRAGSQLDDEKYPHLSHALRSLREAREALKNAEPIFKGSSRRGAGADRRGNPANQNGTGGRLRS